MNYRVTSPSMVVNRVTIHKRLGQEFKLNSLNENNCCGTYVPGNDCIIVNNTIHFRVASARAAVPTQEELASVFRSSKPRGMCSIALMAFSGVRPGVLASHNGEDGLEIRDIPELTIENGKVTFPKVPTMVMVRAELSKMGVKYFSFLSTEGCARAGHKGDIEARYTTNKGRLPESIIEDMREAYKRSQKYLQTMKKGETDEETMRTSFRKQLLLVAGFSVEEVEELDPSMDNETFQEMVRKKLLGSMANTGASQRVIGVDEVERFLSGGWGFVATLPARAKPPPQRRHPTIRHGKNVTPAYPPLIDTPGSPRSARGCLGSTA